MICAFVLPGHDNRRTTMPVNKNEVVVVRIVCYVIVLL